MIRRLQSLIAWNARYRADAPDADSYTGTVAPRNFGRGETRWAADPAIYRIGIRL